MLITLSAHASGDPEERCSEFKETFLRPLACEGNYCGEYTFERFSRSFFSPGFLKSIMTLLKDKKPVYQQSRVGEDDIGKGDFGFPLEYYRYHGEPTPSDRKVDEERKKAFEELFQLEKSVFADFLKAEYDDKIDRRNANVEFHRMINDRRYAFRFEKSEYNTRLEAYQARMFGEVTKEQLHNILIKLEEDKKHHQLMRKQQAEIAAAERARLAEEESAKIAGYVAQAMWYGPKSGLKEDDCL